MKNILLFICCLFAAYSIGKVHGNAASETTVREAYKAGGAKGGDSPALTQWPLCPQAADNYIQQGMHKRGNE